MAKSKHRKGFKEKQQKNKLAKVNKNKLMHHQIDKYKTLMMEEMARVEQEKEMVSSEGILPMVKNLEDETLIENLTSVETIEDVVFAESVINVEEKTK
jgi:3-methyladenine DNA glycosylase/8-oxoguanine DNA glycosylase